MASDGSHSHGSTPRSAHYAVSPRELSLRLHQVIQSRLEERVKELETALEDSQRKLKYMESEHIHRWRDPSNYKTGPFSTQNSPIARDGQEPVDQPVTISLSGEPLASYNEAYEEEFTTKVSESDDEDLKIGFKNEFDVGNGHTDRNSASNGNQFDDWRREEDVWSGSNDNACSSSSRDEGGDGEDDEMERLLIMQIVEKAKQGSPAILKAKTAFLLSHLEIEH